MSMNNDDEESVADGAEEARRAVVLRPVVQAYLNGTGSLESNINDAVWELGVSRATIWRWIKRLAEEGGRTSAPAPRKRGRPAGTTLISSKVEAVIEEHLRRYFLRRERSSLSRVVTEIRSACWQQGLQPPTRRTVQRRLDAMDAREVAKAREGAKVARQKWSPRPCSRPAECRNIAGDDQPCPSPPGTVRDLPKSLSGIYRNPQGPVDIL